MPILPMSIVAPGTIPTRQDTEVGVRHLMQKRTQSRQKPSPSYRSQDIFAHGKVIGSWFERAEVLEGALSPPEFDLRNWYGTEEE